MSHPAGFHLIRLSEGRLYICTVPVIATILYIVFIFSSIVPYPESYTQEKFKIQTADKGPSATCMDALVPNMPWRHNIRPTRTDALVSNEFINLRGFLQKRQRLRSNQ